MSEAKRGRLSALQARIIRAIALHTNDVKAIEARGGYGPPKWVSARDVLYACMPHWRKPDGGTTSAVTIQSSFSRALHNLVFDKQLVSGLALAWMCVSQGYEEFHQWQGGGRRDATATGRPRVKTVCLTKAGWDLFNTRLKETGL